MSMATPTTTSCCCFIGLRFPGNVAENPVVFLENLGFLQVFTMILLTMKQKNPGNLQVTMKKNMRERPLNNEPSTNAMLWDRSNGEFGDGKSCSKGLFGSSRCLAQSVWRIIVFLEDHPYINYFFMDKRRKMQWKCQLSRRIVVNPITNHPIPTPYYHLRPSKIDIFLPHCMDSSLWYHQSWHWSDSWSTSMIQLDDSLIFHDHSPKNWWFTLW